MLQSKKPNINRILVPKGTHIARCIGLIHIGTIDEMYQGVSKKLDKINLTFELPEELHSFKEGEPQKPLVISQEYTLSMGKKSNLRPIVEGVIGTTLTDDEAYGFNHEELVGMACLLSVKHKTSAKGTVYAYIAGTSALMRGQVCKPAFNVFNILTYEKWDQAKFDALPQFIREKMIGSEEYMKMKGVHTDGVAMDYPKEDINPDDIPF